MRYSKLEPESDGIDEPLRTCGDDDCDEGCSSGGCGSGGCCEGRDCGPLEVDGL
jgi:hypothetical protein